MSNTKEITLRVSREDAEELLKKGARIVCDGHCRLQKIPLYAHTRLESRTRWLAANLESFKLTSMDIDYLINVHRMLVCKPSTVISFLTSDINREMKFSGASYLELETMSTQIREITSLSLEELNKMVTESPFFISLCRELKSRRVNVKNLINIYRGDCYERLENNR